MNEETFRDLSGIFALLCAAVPFLALPAVIVYTLYRRFRPAQSKAVHETQIANTQNEPVRALKPSRPGRAVATVIVMTLLAVFWALTIGFTVGVFSHLLYIVFLFPFVMGLNNGKMIAEVIEKTKLRTFSQLVMLSVLTSIVLYGTFHYTRYLGFQFQASMEIYSDFSEATETESLQVTQAFLDYAFHEETGHSGFLGYILYEAQQGASIGRLTRSSSIDLGPALTWLYWLLEFGIILGVTIQKGKLMIGKSFCEACGNWYGSEKHLGGTASANEPFLFDLIRQKDFSGLGKLIEKNAEVPSLEVYFQGCQVCGKSQSQLVVRRASQGTKGTLQFTDASQTTLQPTESSLLLSQLSFSGD